MAVDPEILLLDEPTSALDRIATRRVEELISQLKNKVTVIIVTHKMQQAARISDYTAFMYLGKLVEADQTETIFNRPSSGRFG